jgi:hypothetical protein
MPQGPNSSKPPSAPSPAAHLPRPAAAPAGPAGGHRSQTGRPKAEARRALQPAFHRGGPERPGQLPAGHAVHRADPERLGPPLLVGVGGKKSGQRPRMRPCRGPSTSRGRELGGSLGADVPPSAGHRGPGLTEEREVALYSLSLVGGGPKAPRIGEKRRRHSVGPSPR